MKLWLRNGQARLMRRSCAGILPKAGTLVLAMAWVIQSLQAQTPTESQFIDSVNAAISSLTSGLGTLTHPVVFSGNLVFANGQVVAHAQLNVLMDYVDGLKAAGAERADLNPGVTSITDPAVVSLYDAVVQRIRQLGMQLAINPEISPGELGQNITFQDFQNVAAQNYPQLAARYQPENFVIVHEPTTANGSMHVQGSLQEWDNFIRTLAPLVKAASPHTRLGAGGFQNGAITALSGQENTYWQDFVTIPALDFMTMDVYNDDTFPTYAQWIQLAKANNKGIYIEETWKPHYLPVPLPPTAFSSSGNLTQPLDSLSIVGSVSADFATLDATWLQAMAEWASANDMEAVTAFITQAFFAFGAPGFDKITSTGYSTAVINALEQGQSTSVAPAYHTDVNTCGIPEVTSLSSASYATMTSVYTPGCPGGPCFAKSTVAADELVSAFGADLATSSAVTSSTTFPTNLAGTTATLVDSSNQTLPVPFYSVSRGQINYLVPTAVKPGPATLTVTSQDGTESSGIVLITPVAPGLYTANANGAGAPAAIAVTGHAGGSQSTQFAFTCPGAGNCTPQPISLGLPTDTVVVELFGTGIRHVSSPSAVAVQVNGQTTVNGQVLKVLYAGPQPTYPGLDQVNIQIPRAMAGMGQVELALVIQDSVNNVNATTNTVLLSFE